jgi:hypothetical protein
MNPKSFILGIAFALLFIGGFKLVAVVLENRERSLQNEAMYDCLSRGGTEIVRHSSGKSYCFGPGK